MWGKNDSDEKFHDIFDIIYRYLFVICHLIHDDFKSIRKFFEI